MITSCPDCSRLYNPKEGHCCSHTGLTLVPESTEDDDCLIFDRIVTGVKPFSAEEIRVGGINLNTDEPKVGEHWWVKFPDKLEVLGHKILYVTPKLITFDVDGFEFTFRRQDIDLVERAS